MLYIGQKPEDEIVSLLWSELGKLLSAKCRLNYRTGWVYKADSSKT